MMDGDSKRGTVKLSLTWKGFGLIAGFTALCVALEYVSSQIAYLPYLDVVVFAVLALAISKFDDLTGITTALIGAVYLSIFHVWKVVTLGTSAKFALWIGTLTGIWAFCTYLKAQVRRRDYKESLRVQEELERRVRQRTDESLALSETVRASELRFLRESQESEQRLRQLTEALPQMVWTAKANGDVDYYNQQWFDYTGMTLAETKGWGWEPVIHPDDLRTVVDTWKNSLATGTPYEIQMRMKRGHDSTYRWHISKATPFRNENGDIEKWFGANTDIHDAREAHRLLRESEDRTQAVVSNASVILWSVDKNGVYTYSEGAALLKLGSGPGKRVGLSMFEVYKDVPMILDGLRRALKGESVTVLVEIKQYWFEAVFTPFIGKDGLVSGVVGASFDVTNRVRAEMKLKESRAHLETIIRNSPVALWSIDKEGVFTLADGRALETLGLNAESLIGKSVFQVFSENRQLLADVQRVLKGETISCEIQVNQSHLEAHFSPIIDVSGEVTGANGLTTDVTARRISEHQRSEAIAREQAALAASDMKTKFLANMSHEIRTPINGVLGMTSLLLDTSLSDEQRGYAETVRGSADNLLSIINDILDITKAEAGKIDLEIIDFEVEHVFVDIERTLLFAAKRKGVKLIKHIPEETPRFLKGDPSRLRQILVNLVNNAIKFTNHGHVIVECSLDEGPRSTDGTIAMRFEVTDTGIGIPDEALERLFKAFSQADSSTTRKYGGTGLGLSISKHLVELMGGTIGVKSTEGRGSTFWFTIPLRVGHAPAESTDQKLTAPLPTRSLRILVAEDNSVNQLIAMKMLQKMGHNPVVVANGNEVLDQLRDSKFDLVLMDCQMPELDGYETTKIIRKSPVINCQEIPIIAMTANAMNGDREKCLDAGMNDYISKPVKAADLESAIQMTYNRLTPLSA